ncbi:MAG: PEGA domain-containing protein, partial [Deltaproteobacteria bacterium]|nr:PEGA domain-containing protein [Deltaproteobacteria bacterium]
AIVLRSLERRPEDRYPSAAAMRDDVLALLGDETRLVPSDDAPTSQDPVASDKYASLDAVASLDDLELVTLDEASRGSPQGASALITGPSHAHGDGRGVPPRAPRRDAALRPLPADSAQALPRKPVSTAPREVDLDPVAASSSLELVDAGVSEDASEAASPTSKKARRAGGFPAEGAIAGVVYAGQARRRRWGSLRLLFWLILLGGLGFGGYWAYMSYRAGAFSREVMVVIDTTPKGAIITVDGIRLVRQPLVFRRSSREAQVTVKAPGYETAYTSFRPDTDIAMRVDLIPLIAPAPGPKSVKTSPGKRKHPRGKHRRRSKKRRDKSHAKKKKKGRS